MEGFQIEVFELIGELDWRGCLQRIEMKVERELVLVVIFMSDMVHYV